MNGSLRERVAQYWSGLVQGRLFPVVREKVGTVVKQAGELPGPAALGAWARSKKCEENRQRVRADEGCASLIPCPPIDFSEA